MKHIGRFSKGSRIKYSDFYCTKCKSKITLPRIYQTREKGHIKTMWCYKCKAEENFVEVRERDFILENVCVCQ